MDKHFFHLIFLANLNSWKIWRTTWFVGQLKTFKASSLSYTKEKKRSELPRNLNNY
jgi:hypothetical protein